MAKNNSHSQDRLNNLKKDKNTSKRNTRHKTSNQQRQVVKNLEDKLSVYENVIAELRTQLQSQEETMSKQSQAETDSTSSVDTETPVDPRGADMSEFAEASVPESPVAVDTQEVERLEAQLTVAKGEAEDWKTKCLRTLADLQNLQKQTELDIQQSKKQAKKNTVFALLEFLNTLNISFSYLPASEDEKVLGFYKTLQGSFEKVIGDLRNSGIEVMRVQPGDDFDAEYMNILNTQVGEGEVENKVVQVVGIGLKVDNQLVQPASVIIK